MPMPPLAPEFAHLAEFDIGFAAESIDVPAIRSMIEQLLPAPSPVEGVVARQVAVGSDPTVVVETYASSADEPRPAVLWLHGGGYFIGTAAMDGDRLQRWARLFGCFAASVEYRLAPDHPFPAAHDDALRALEWLVDSADELGVDPGRIVVGGASAGGGLAAALVLAARDRGVPLAGQLLFYPMLDDRQETTSSRWPAPIWSPAANEFGWRSYLGAAYGTDVPDYAAPARASSVDGLPPTMVLVGGVDGFLDEDLHYATRLMQAGIPTDVRVYAGAPHGFDLLAPESRVAGVATADAEAWLAAILGPPS